MSLNVWTEESGKGTFSLDIPNDPKNLTAKDIMQYGVFSIHPMEPVAKAVSILIEKNISGLPVVSENKLEGVLSDKDLLKLMYKNSYLPGAVADYMTTGACCFDVEDKVYDITRYLSEQTFRRVPILHNGRLAGIITRGDLLNTYKQTLCSNPEAKSDTQGIRYAEDIMTQGLHTVKPQSQIHEAMDKLTKYKITGLPIVDSGMQLLGMITEKDLLSHVIQPRRTQTEVGDIMTRSVISLPPKASINDICQCLIDNSFHRIPIVHEGRLMGVISRSDVLKSRLSVFQI